MTNLIAAPVGGVKEGVLKRSESAKPRGQFARLLQRQQIVHLLRTTGPLARADLADQLGLPRPLITSVVAELMDEGTLVELESRIEGVAQRGRPRILLDCNPHGRQVIGIQIDPVRARVILASAAGNYSRELQTPTGDRTPTSVIRSIIRLAKQLMDQSDDGTTVAAGVCIPGLVDDETGLVIEAHDLGWKKVELGKSISRALGIPTAVENTTIAITLNETIAGTAREARSAVVLDYGGRLGVGLIIGGRPYTGATGIAGAISHVPVYGSTAACRCGQVGCFEADMSLLAMQAAAPQTIGVPFDDIDLDAVSREIARNPQSQRIIRDIIDRAAHTAMFIEALIDPELLIIAGLIVEFDELARALEARIDEIRPPERRGRTRTVRSHLRRDAEISVVVALQQLDPAIASMMHGSTE